MWTNQRVRMMPRGSLPQGACSDSIEVSTAESNREIGSGTLRVRRRRANGGYHLYFKTPFPCANKNLFPDGIDVRGAVGYVVGPGSEIVEKVLQDSIAHLLKRPVGRRR